MQELSTEPAPPPPPPPPPVDLRPSDPREEEGLHPAKPSNGFPEPWPSGDVKVLSAGMPREPRRTAKLPEEEPRIY